MSHELPPLTPKKVIRTLERGGFYVHHTTGGHYALRRPTNPAIWIIVPYHTSPFKVGNQKSISYSQNLCDATKKKF